MSKFGLTDERYEQLMKKLNNDENELTELIYEWGLDALNKGYSTFDFDGTGMEQVQRIDATDTFEDDAAAVTQAEKDGVKFIPIAELPENFERRYLGWIDTPENRKAIQEYCDKKPIDYRLPNAKAIVEKRMDAWIASNEHTETKIQLTHVVSGDFEDDFDMAECTDFNGWQCNWWTTMNYKGYTFELFGEAYYGRILITCK